MKKKINLANPLDNAELLEEIVLQEEREKIAKFKTYLLDKRYYYKDGSYRLIYNTLKRNVGENWNEIRNNLRTKIKQELHYRIDGCVLYKNRNGAFIDSYGQIKTLLPTIYTTGRIWEQYYIEDDIIKVYKPYRKFVREKQPKTIVKKVKSEIRYNFKFDQELDLTKQNNNVITPLFTSVAFFIRWCEQHKQTYRVIQMVDRVSGRWNKYNKRFESVVTTHPQITHIKTNYT